VVHFIHILARYGRRIIYKKREHAMTQTDFSSSFQSEPLFQGRVLRQGLRRHGVLGIETQTEMLEQSQQLCAEKADHTPLFLIANQIQYQLLPPMAPVETWTPAPATASLIARISQAVSPTTPPGREQPVPLITCTASNGTHYIWVTSLQAWISSTDGQHPDLEGAGFQSQRAMPAQPIAQRWQVPRLTGLFRFWRKKQEQQVSEEGKEIEEEEKKKRRVFRGGRIFHREATGATPPSSNQSNTGASPAPGSGGIFRRGHRQAQGGTSIGAGHARSGTSIGTGHARSGFGSGGGSIGG
jgi:hypothetical protein